MSEWLRWCEICHQYHGENDKCPMTSGIEIGRDMRIEIEHDMERIVTTPPNTELAMPRYYASGGTLTEVSSEPLERIECAERLSSGTAAGGRP